MLKLHLYRSGCLLLAIACGLLSFRLLPVKGSSFAAAPDIAWANPDQKAFNDTGPVASTADDRRYDCQSLTYRIHGDLSKTMHSGCFVTAAFGLYDPDQSVVIFNGTDEAEPVRYGGQPAAVSVLPYSDSAARFGGFPSLGSYMYLYTHFSSSLSDGGNLLTGRLKEITSLPNFTVSDPDGQPLAVNPLAFAYSAQGQWLVTESPNHSLVRVNLATYSVLPFAKPFEISATDYASHEASMAVSEDGRYVAVASNEFTSLKIYDLKTCIVTSSSDPLLPQNCQSHDYWPYVKSQVAGSLQRLSHLDFVGDDLLNLDASTSSGTDSYVLSPKSAITSLIPYLGLGDSYASGQGAFDYDIGTDTAVNHCHLSTRSYPLLLNGDLFGGQGHSVACSGAVIHDIASQSMQYTGQTTDQSSALSRQADGSEVNILHDFTPGNLAQQNFVTSYQPGVITVQIGGNDVGFGDMLLRCLAPVEPDKNQIINPNNCYQSYEDRLEVAQAINRTYSKWVQLYRQLRQQSPLSRVYAIGYPHIVSLNDDCRTNVPLTAKEVEFSRDVVNYLNSAIAQAARAAGVRYVDISDALAGHELCSGGSGDLAMNGLTAGNDEAGVIGQESFHPNRFGHQLIEQAILKATHNLTDSLPVAQPATPVPTADNSDPLLQAPQSGRTVNTVIPSTTMVTGHTTRGGSLTITIDGSSSGLAANTTYSVTVGSGAVAGTIKSDDQGNVHGTVSVPGDTGSGPQPVSVGGSGQDGTPVTVVQVVYVNNSSNDYDGDGIPNDQDSCPLVINSGLDIDKDGLDDACDNSIATLSSAGQSTPPSGGVVVTTLTDNPVTVAPQTTQTPTINQLSTADLQTNDPLVSVQPSDGFMGYASLSVLPSSTVKPLRVAARTVSGAKRLVLGAVHKPVFATAIGPVTLPKQPLPRFWWFAWLGICLLLLLIILSRGSKVHDKRG